MPTAVPAYSLVTPVYNEGERVFANLEAIAMVMRMLGPIELIAVNDGSNDQTRSEIERLRQRLPEIRALHLPHEGKGQALRVGARAATGEYVIFFDSDLDLPPEQILFFVALQRAHAADAVIGSKMHPDSTVHYPLRRRLYSWGYFLLTKLLFRLPVRDTQTGLKLVRRGLLVEALEHTEVKGFAMDLELLVRLVRLRARMVEAPVVVRYKEKFGGIGFGTVREILAETLAVWKRTR
ncbi:MAG: glycosyltransferase family 2 protein [Verrucomicrobiota bacterium]